MACIRDSLGIMEMCRLEAAAQTSRSWVQMEVASVEKKDAQTATSPDHR